MALDSPNKSIIAPAISTAGSNAARKNSSDDDEKKKETGHTTGTNNYAQKVSDSVSKTNANIAKGAVAASGSKYPYTPNFGYSTPQYNIGTPSVTGKSNGWDNVASPALDKNGNYLTGGGATNFRDSGTIADSLKIDVSKLPNIDELRNIVSNIPVVGDYANGQNKQMILDHLIKTFPNEKILQQIADSGLTINLAGNLGSFAFGQIAGLYHSDKHRVDINMHTFDPRVASHEFMHMAETVLDGRLDGNIPFTGYAEAMNDAERKVRSGQYTPGAYTRFDYAMGQGFQLEGPAVLMENYVHSNEAFRKDFPQLTEVFDNLFGHFDSIIRLNPGGQDQVTEEPSQEANPQSNPENKTSQVDQINKTKEELIAEREEDLNTETQVA